MDWLYYVICGVIGYFIGNFSTAYIVSMRAAKRDIREVGSGNAGSTNVLRTMGKKWGFITFFADILKGVLSVLIGRWIAGHIGGCVAGVMVVVGHNWPVLLGFRGGKGIAASAGVIFMLQPLGGAIMAAIAIIIILLTKYVSVGSIVGCIGTPILSLILAPTDTAQHIVFAILAVLGVISHRENIKRLIHGNENKIYFDKLKP